MEPGRNLLPQEVFSLKQKWQTDSLREGDHKIHLLSKLGPIQQSKGFYLGQLSWPNFDL